MAQRRPRVVGVRTSGPFCAGGCYARTTPSCALASVAQDLQDAGLDARAVRARLAAEYPDEVAAADVAFGQLELAG